MHCHSCRYLAQLCCLAVRVRKRVRKCPKLVHPRVVAMADFASSVTLSPSEYRGDPNTCVAGRVVILRGPIELRPRVESNQPAAPANASKGKKGKGAKGAKGKKGDATEARIKTEVHVLGGDSAAEILFSDAWAENAKDLVKLIELGKVYRFAGAKYIAKPPEYSRASLISFALKVASVHTSKLPSALIIRGLTHRSSILLPISRTSAAWATKCKRVLLGC